MLFTAPFKVNIIFNLVSSSEFSLVINLPLMTHNWSLSKLAQRNSLGNSLNTGNCAMNADNASYWLVWGMV